MEELGRESEGSFKGRGLPVEIHPPRHPAAVPDSSCGRAEVGDGFLRKAAEQSAPMGGERAPNSALPLPSLPFPADILPAPVLEGRP